MPANWQLVRRSSTGIEDVLAKNVLAYDIAATMIEEQVIFLDAPSADNEPVRAFLVYL